MFFLVQAWVDVLDIASLYREAFELRLKLDVVRGNGGNTTACAVGSDQAREPNERFKFVRRECAANTIPPPHSPGQQR